MDPLTDDETEAPGPTEAEMATARELGVEDLATTIYAAALQEEDAMTYRHPSLGTVAIDGQNHTVLKTQLPEPARPDLVAPEQIFSSVPADAWYWSDAARAKAEGWKPPLPVIDECLRQREALRLACHRAGMVRSGDVGRIRAAVIDAADLTKPDPSTPVLEEMVASALNEFLDKYLGVTVGPVASLSWELETRWRRLIHANQQAMLRSLLDRDSPACNRLRAFVVGMDRAVDPPALGLDDYRIMP